ncbi:unnamed protein product [Rotaria sp. Silwood1]|nr:unnamed protein product [Rotaria sp. Silwood1]CAF4595629.1 unnamed protein product [Rotaria sp. Silwood1]
MFNNYLLLLLLISLVVTICVPTINAYGFCTCSCCDGSGCDPLFEGSIEISSCDGTSCLEACKKSFPLSCDSPTTGKLKYDCKDIRVINETTTPTTLPSTPWPVPTTTTITTPSILTTTTSSTTATTGNITVTITTTSTETTSIGNITVTISTTTTPGSTNSTRQTSPQTTLTTTITPLPTTISTTAEPPKTTTKSHSGASVLCESSSFIVLIVTSIFIVKFMH